MIEEVWKSVSKYDGYIVSSHGRVKSLKRPKRVILRQGTNKQGYKIVSLNKQTIKVHQLVAIAFLNHTPCGMDIVVDHIDNNKLNNRLENLQLISQRQNTSKTLRGGSKYTGVSWYSRDSKWQSSIRINGKKKSLGRFKCELAAAEAYNKKLKEING